MEQLSQSIQDAIKKNMPEMVGKELQELLKEGAKATLDLETTKKKLDEVTIRSNEKTALLQEHEAIDMERAALIQQKKEIEEQERNLKVSKLEHQLQVANEKTDFAKEVALGLVRNTIFRESSFSKQGAILESGNDQNGGYFTKHAIDKEIDKTAD
jgi:phosphoglycerate-specific signal transduction histidine kinase